MMPLPAPQPPAPMAPLSASGLEDTLSAVESRLADLGEALRTGDLAGIDTHSADLHLALAKAVDTFCAAVRHGPVAPALRRRLVSASGQVAAQRESLARATSALDRAIDVLMPRETAAVYSAVGVSRRERNSGAMRA